MQSRRFIRNLTWLTPVLALAGPNAAMAANGGGGGWPWDQWMQQFAQSLGGGVALVIIMIAAISAAGRLAMGGDFGYFGQGAATTILVMSFLGGILLIAARVGFTGAVL